METTPVCGTAEEALRHLRALRRHLVRRAGAQGLAVYAAASHPWARGEEQAIVATPRYQRMVMEVGAAARRQLVCGLHVHAGMPDSETCLRALEGSLPWLSLVLKLSANSPFLEGRRQGPRSLRAGRLAELDSVGPPPLLATWPIGSGQPG
ncbi:MAG: carboxylate--amine ligase, partial [Chloroflexota bacterium]